jgi:3',5'-cyclic AMP phosphodiesterase CpdA
MKIAHLTDLHYQSPPSISDLWAPKRWIGSINLYIRGRVRQFERRVQDATVDLCLQEKPDAVLITGDLTAMSTSNEFEMARESLQPLLNSIPTFIIPGNHDIYVKKGVPKAMTKYLGDWMGKGSPSLFNLDGVSALHIETCFPDFLSRGWVDPNHLLEASELLHQVPKDNFLFLTLHYPLFDRRGNPHDKWTRNVRNGEIFRDWLIQHPRIDALIHGHEHHGYHIQYETTEGKRHSINPGSSGYALEEYRSRCAHVNFYNIDSRKLTDIQRWKFTAEGFVEKSEPYHG